MEQYNLRLADQSDIPNILPIYKENIDIQFHSKSPSAGYSDDAIFEILKHEISIHDEISGLYIIENSNKEILASSNIYFSLHRNGYTFLRFHYKKGLKEAEVQQLLELMVKLCFQDLNYNKINVEIRRSQIEYINIFIKCGFQEEVILREHFYIDGTYEDITRLGITKTDYINKVISPVLLTGGNVSKDEDFKLKPNLAPANPTLQGEKIFLSSITDEDTDLIYNLYSDSDDKYYASIEAAAPNNYQTIKSLSQRDNDYKSFREGISFSIKKKDGTLVGTMNAAFIDRRNRNLMLGITIYNSLERGNGYGSEAIKLFTDFAFLEMNMHRVYLGCFGFNSRAFNLYQHLGFKHEGTNRSFVYRNGNYYDEYVLGVLKQEWLVLRGYL